MRRAQRQRLAGGLRHGVLLAAWVGHAVSAAQPASALHTAGLPRIETQSSSVDGAAVTALTAWVGDTPRRIVLGTITEANAAASHSIRVQWFQPAAADAALASIAALEEAYGRLFRLPATAYYSIDAGSIDGSQAAMLALVAELRSRAIGELPWSAGRLPFRPWIRIALSVASGDVPRDGFAGQRVMALRRELQQSMPDPHVVAVDVRSDGEIPAEAQVVFSRDPHHVCSARIARQGLAACRLEDQHGHDPAAHVGEGARKTVATFSGALRADVVFLPTTLVY